MQKGGGGQASYDNFTIGNVNKEASPKNSTVIPHKDKAKKDDKDKGLKLFQGRLLRKSFYVQKLNNITENNQMSNLEYFDALKKISNVAKFKKDKSQQKKFPNVRKIAADATKCDELGQINWYGIATKHRRGLKFHQRWIVLRGLNLYWYRKALDNSEKGMLTLPSIPLSMDKDAAKGRQNNNQKVRTIMNNG